MDIANKNNGMVIGTGDMSELALGWATYNGDHMSMYGVNASVPKTLVRHLVNGWPTPNRMRGPRHAARHHRHAGQPELLPADKDGGSARRPKTW